MDPAEFAVPLLVSSDIQQKIAENPDVAEFFFSSDLAKVRALYRKTGNPRLALLVGGGAVDLARKLEIRGCVSLAVLELFLAEMAIAVGSSSADLARAERYLADARTQAEVTPRVEFVGRLLIDWHWLMSICAKAAGREDDYHHLLRTGVHDQAIARFASPSDYVPIVRQQVMLNQDLDQHLALLTAAAAYQRKRPLEYFRTVKRVMEFLTNQGMMESAEALKGQFIEAFAAVANTTTLISKISFLKNLAHLSALGGDVAEAGRLVDRAKSAAVGARLDGQVRQLVNLQEAIGQQDVRGALLTFRV